MSIKFKDKRFNKRDQQKIGEIFLEISNNLEYLNEEDSWSYRMVLVDELREMIQDVIDIGFNTGYRKGALNQQPTD